MTRKAHLDTAAQSGCTCSGPAAYQIVWAEDIDYQDTSGMCISSQMQALCAVPITPVAKTATRTSSYLPEAASACPSSLSRTMLATLSATETAGLALPPLIGWERPCPGLKAAGSPLILQPLVSYKTNGALNDASLTEKSQKVIFCWAKS